MSLRPEARHLAPGVARVTLGRSAHDGLDAVRARSRARSDLTSLVFVLNSSDYCAMTVENGMVSAL